MITVFRIDDRLLHGQVARSWTKQYRINKIVIVNDEVANDEFSRMTLCLAKPKDVELKFSEVKQCAELLNECEGSEKNIMCIVGNFKDALHVLEYVPRISTVNIGGVRNKSDEENLRIGRSVCLSGEDVRIVKSMISKGIELEIRQIPGEKKILLEQVIDYE
ncbi:MAG: PTS sugar transporter subunit IIB [Bacilli bacterium]